ncbi:Ankyrin repeats (3 copies) [Symmachiella dynata]|uniref:ankyrin repeat domain-containing protein n=1 Tax=Symmachiella dynata TaxID=2527995 RepID=UPI00118B6904|nr:ankyrin repeat domain-containing protein [Symmachiella dynata]QDT51604.1 Ankyrin repeats (3 copies) [Symmachiella dynata]
MKSKINRKKIFDAARNSDLKMTRACLEAGAKPAARNEYGFTALHCAAMGTNTGDLSKILAVMRLLIEAGSPLESIGGGGRTPLYLAAEFSPSTEPIQLLLDAGANPNTRDEHGNHIVTNAMTPEAQELLSRVTGEPVPEPPPPEPELIKMTAEQWNEAKRHIDSIFDQLSEAGLVTLQDAGYTQEDGFSDCAEVFHDRGGEKAGLHGCCFYTRQDLDRAKQTSQLQLAFWGAPKGQPNDMERVGQLIVDAFRENGFSVNWDGSGGKRPTVYLFESV